MPLCLHHFSPPRSTGIGSLCLDIPLMELVLYCYHRKLIGQHWNMSFAQPQSSTSKVTFDPSTYLTRLALAGIKVGQQPKLTVRVFAAVLLEQAPFICRVYLSNVAPIYSRLFFTLGLNNRDKLRKRTRKNKSSKSVRTRRSQPNEQNSGKCNLSFGPWSQYPSSHNSAPQDEVCTGEKNRLIM